MLRKSDVTAPPSLRKETVLVPELNGEVVVQGMLLRDRLEVGVTKGYGRMAHMLAACVLVLGEGSNVLFATEDEARKSTIRNTRLRPFFDLRSTNL